MTISSFIFNLFHFYFNPTDEPLAQQPTTKATGHPTKIISRYRVRTPDVYLSFFYRRTPVGKWETGKHLPLRYAGTP